MASLANNPFNIDKLKEVMEYHGLNQAQLAIKAFAERGKEHDKKHINSICSALRRDIKNQTMSDVRLDKIAQALNCNVYYLKGDFPNATYDPEHFGYDFGYWNDLRKNYHDMVRDLIYFMPSYPTHFKYEDVQKLTDEDILEITNKLRPKIDDIVEPILNRRIYSIDIPTNK